MRLTKEQARIRKRYTSVGKLYDEWAASLVIDHQSFRICSYTTKGHATWQANMLAIALERMLRHEHQEEAKP